MIAKISKKFSVPIIYVNQVGANDELIFDGASLVFNKEAKLVNKLKSFAEDYTTIDLNEIENLPAIATIERGKENIFSIIDDINSNSAAELESALVLGLQDYIYKCFQFD